MAAPCMLPSYMAIIQGMEGGVKAAMAILHQATPDQIVILHDGSGVRRKTESAGDHAGVTGRTYRLGGKG